MCASCFESFGRGLVPHLIFIKPFAKPLRCGSFATDAAHQFSEATFTFHTDDQRGYRTAELQGTPHARKIHLHSTLHFACATHTRLNDAKGEQCEDSIGGAEWLSRAAN